MKRILITGAASGLGLALAKKYACEGWSVCIADIQNEEGIKVA
ncbi:MAG: SDR family NAD(P)-dependent oxidoreductase, partial [Rhodobacteraceae bacterium]|nr:SDR family NAD(P)-dependent oxidoreductase [Paracoccaceae bacterium]